MPNTHAVHRISPRNPFCIDIWKPLETSSHIPWTQGLLPHSASTEIKPHNIYYFSLLWVFDIWSPYILFCHSSWSTFRIISYILQYTLTEIYKHIWSLHKLPLYSHWHSQTYLVSSQAFHYTLIDIHKHIWSVHKLSIILWLTFTSISGLFTSFPLYSDWHIQKHIVSSPYFFHS